MMISRVAPMMAYRRSSVPVARHALRKPTTEWLQYLVPTPGGELLANMEAHLLSDYGSFDEAFRAFDADKNGLIDRSELCDMIAQLTTERPTVGEEEMALRVLDTNVDGKISKKEFKAWYNASVHRAKLAQRRSERLEEARLANDGLFYQPAPTLAEAQMRKAQEEGVFDNLPGSGRPLHRSTQGWVDTGTEQAMKVVGNAGFRLMSGVLKDEAVEKLEAFREMLDRELRAGRKPSAQTLALFDKINEIIDLYNSACIKESIEYNRMLNQPVGKRQFHKEEELSKNRLAKNA